MTIISLTAATLLCSAVGSLDTPAASAAATEPLTSSCSTDADCSFNGACTGSPRACTCDAAWEGPRCGNLRLLPTTRSAGLRAVDGGHNTSTWGGTVALDPTTGRQHMWASEMAYHCGIDAWKINSFVVHAVAEKGSDVFTRVASRDPDMIFPIFTHEPSMSRGPSGEWVLYWSGYPQNHSLGPPCRDVCSDGWTPRTGCALPRGGSPPTYMSWAHGPDGPWSAPVQVLAASWDTNLAVVILANGSAVGMARRSGMPVYLVTASDWRNASSYRYHEGPPFASQLPAKAAIEDGNVYMDERGRFHAIFHMGLNGIHTFSADGVRWTYGGVAWNNTVAFQDGKSYSFKRRERPHFVFGDLGNPHRITALTTGVAFEDGTAEGDGDACYTLYQPVNRV